MQTDRGRQQWHLWALYITKKENMEPQRSMCRTTFAFLRRKESGQNGKSERSGGCTMTFREMLVEDLEQVVDIEQNLFLYRGQKKAFLLI